MVAPNGARRGKKDHPALPVSITEIAQTAAACHAAGAGAIHAHVRDNDGAHVLDAGLYGELLCEIKNQSPEVKVQITTESAGKYSPDEQRRLLYDLRPPWASVSLAEMTADGDDEGIKGFYWRAHDENIEIQHILYSPREAEQLTHLCASGVIPSSSVSVLLVLGRYSPATDGTAEMLTPFLETIPRGAKFMACAFGKDEYKCLLAAAKAGGDCRIGFENNLHLANGTIAADNAEKVSELIAMLSDNSFNQL